MPKRVSVTDTQDWFTFHVDHASKGPNDPGSVAPVYVEVYDGNMGSVVVESKLTWAKARELGNALLAAADE